MKRALDIVDEDDGYVFKFRDGAPIPPEMLVSRFKHQLMTLLSFRMSMTFLANMERSGSVLRNFVRSNNLWCILFQRDYPDQFESAHEPGSYQMRAETRAWLDGMSDNPERPETYWKRFYEYMTKLTRMLKAEEDSLNLRPPNVYSPSDMFSNTSSEYLSWLLDHRRYPYLDWVNPQGRKLAWGAQLRVKKDAGGDVLYIYATGFAAFSDFLDKSAKGIIMHPTEVIRVALGAELAADVVPWDDRILTLETVDYHRGRGIVIWPSRDGQHVYMMEADGPDHIFKRRAAPVNNLRLVSACVTCDTPHIAGKCDQCHRQYCSQDCLDADCHH